MKHYNTKYSVVILSDFSKKSNLKFNSETNAFMGKKKVIPKPIRKSSNGMVWPLQQIPMLEVSMKVKNVLKTYPIHTLKTLII